MALLGVHWHTIGPITSAMATGGAVQGAAFSAINHSLGTTPDLVMPFLRSVGVGANAINGFQGLAQLGGNASLLTVGPIIGSVATCPTVAFDVYAARIWSGSR